jgi:thioredoxin 2
MSALIIACKSCGAKNRIPEKKQHLQPRCGKCQTEMSFLGRAVPVNLGDEDFQQFIKMTQIPVMVDFFAPTCGPCQALAPIITKCANRYLGKIVIAKVDTSMHPGTAVHYNIRGVPSLLFFKNSIVIDQLVGAPPELTLINKLDNLLQQ